MKLKRDIAIIGMASRFPDAKNLDELYNNLAAGTDSIRGISNERLNTTSLPLDIDYRNCGYLAEVDKFDHHFFNLSLAEAQTMEPNQRVLLEVVHEIFDNSGYNIDDFKGSNTSVFVSEAGNEYYRLAKEIAPTLITGNGKEFLAARIASQYDLRGTAAMINTSCSSALAAVHFACSELILAEADLAVVCAVNIDLFPFNDNSMNLDLLSPDGKSRAFSAGANGMSRGEMAGGVLLKPLDRALKDKDIIHAVIKGSAINNNANRSGSLTTPNSQSLAEVCRRAWKRAGIDPRKIGFIEAHGSGTQLGDSLEIEGLDLAFKHYTDNKKFCAISTIKANTGHNVFASGMSGLIKAVLSLKKKALFPAVHFDEPNPVIDFENSAVYVNDKFKKWNLEEGEIRYAGVTSIGFSGTNCHMVLQEPPSSYLNEEPGNTGSNQRDYLIAISSKTAAGLKQNLIEIKKTLTVTDYNLPDISYTLNKGRKHYNYRTAFLVNDRDTLLKELDKTVISSIPGKRPARELNKIIFIFSDHNPIPGNLLSYFMDSYEVFDKSFKECKDVTSTPANKHFSDFAFQYGFYRLLESYGIMTTNILSIGIGKLIAKVIPGEISLKEGVVASLSYKPEEIPYLEDRVKNLINNETRQEPVFFIDMGPGGILSKELERQKGEQGNFNVFRITGVNKDPLLVLLKLLYLSNYQLDWNQIYRHFDGRKIELPGYQFNRKRCWIREDPVGVFFDLVRIPPGVAGDEKKKVPKHPDENGSGIEEKIAASWKEVLEVERFSLNDDFFELGGDSLKATKVIKNLVAAFDVDLDFEDIFDYPTIRSLGKYIADRMNTGQKVAAIWKEVLKLEKVGPEDNFFLLGGHSLLATQILLGIKKEFNLELNFEDIFIHPTLYSLSEYINQQLSYGDKKVDYLEIKPAAEKEYYSLSFAQKRMYLQQEIEPTSTSYNTPVKVRLEGNLDRKRLEMIFRELIKRHESLRTSFEKFDDRIIQRIHEEVDFKMEYLELAGDEIDKIFKKFVRPFDPGRAPLLRVLLVKTARERYMLILDMHHIITDATSMQLAAKDFMLLYNNQDLPLLKIQYKDFSQWQNNLFSSGKIKEQETYWLNQFNDDIPVLKLPYDYPAPVLRSLDKGDLIIFFIREELRNRLLNRVMETETTLFIFLLAVYYILLFKYTGQTDIVVGSTVTGRTHPALQDIIGMFVNMLPMRNSPGEQKSFKTFLAEVKVNALNAYKNQDYPLDQLVVRLNMPGDHNRKQLFNTEFAMNNIEIQELKIPGLSLKILDDEAKFAKFDLHFQLTEINDAVRIVLRYSTELFKRSSVEQIKDHYIEILRQVVENIGIKPIDIKLSHTLLTPESHIREELSGNFTI